jgi:hypothetical protein
MVGLLVLLLLDPGQHLAETLVLDDGRVADALQLVEDGVKNALRHSLRQMFGQKLIAVNSSQATYESKRLKDWARHVRLLLFECGHSQKPSCSHRNNGRARKDKISAAAERGCLLKILFAGLYGEAAPFGAYLST